MIGRPGQRDLLDLLPQRELRRPATRYFGASESNPSVLKLCNTFRTRSALANVTFAIPATSMPCADSSTICARRNRTSPSLVGRIDVKLVSLDLPGDRSRESAVMWAGDRALVCPPVGNHDGCCQHWGGQVRSKGSIQ
jgi:hypothetical protein